MLILARLGNEMSCSPSSGVPGSWREELSRDRYSSRRDIDRMERSVDIVIWVSGISRSVRLVNRVELKLFQSINRLLSLNCVNCPMPPSMTLRGNGESFVKERRSMRGALEINSSQSSCITSPSPQMSTSWILSRWPYRTSLKISKEHSSRSTLMTSGAFFERESMTGTHFGFEKMMLVHSSGQARATSLQCRLTWETVGIQLRSAFNSSYESGTQRRKISERISTGTRGKMGGPM